MRYLSFGEKKGISMGAAIGMTAMPVAAPDLLIIFYPCVVPAGIIGDIALDVTA